MFKRLTLLMVLLVSLSAGLMAQVMYRISGAGLPAPSYLLGSHHMVSPDALDKLPLDSVFNAVGCVVGEMDFSKSGSNSMAMTVMKYAQAPSDSTLTKLIPDSTFNRISVTFRDLTGLDLQTLDAMRPVMVSNIITVMQMSKRGDFSQDNQIDINCQKEAMRRGIPVVGLETAEEQARILFLSQPLDKQAADLVETLSDPDKMLASLDRLNASYLAGDLDDLYALSMETETDPQFADALLRSRNLAWMPVLTSLISEKPTLIVVGALHLAGPDGLLKLLQDQGYSIVSLRDN